MMLSDVVFDSQHFLSKNIGDSNSSLRIEISELEGRVIVAARDIAPGELVLREKALDWSPRYNTLPLCLSCYKHLLSYKDSWICVCGWPLCSKECSQSKEHQIECKLFVNHKIDASSFHFDGSVESKYDVIGPLRLLLQRDSSKWKDFHSLMSHKEDWKEKSDWIESHQDVIESISSFLSIEDKDIILTIFAIYYTNDFSIKIDSGVHVPPSTIRLCYLLSSLLSHDCCPNTIRTFESNLENQFPIEIRAKRHIYKNEKITINYVDLMLPTSIRQNILQSSKFFTCQCKRCLDPSELNSHGSSFICPNCKSEILPQAPKWEAYCLTCKSITILKAKELIQRIYHEAEELIKNSQLQFPIETFENFLVKHSKYLHRQHMLLTMIRYSLSGLYGRLTNCNGNNMTVQQLHRKKDIAEECLMVLNNIDPHISFSRGMLMYELHMPYILLSQLEKKDKNESKNIFKKGLDYLQHSLNYLQYEDSTTFEGKIYSEAISQLEPLQNYLKEL